MSAPQLQADPLMWARRLREREHQAGLGSKVLTRAQRTAWRRALWSELTDAERNTAPREEAEQR